jgi:hypothetical protein
MLANEVSHKTSVRHERSAAPNGYGRGWPINTLPIIWRDDAAISSGR